MSVESDLAQATAAAERQTVRVPSNLYAHIRASYDTREKVLDWCLALAVVTALVWMFRDDIRQWCLPEPDVNAGRDDPPEPSQDVSGALPRGQAARADVYTYNMPTSRRIRFGMDNSTGTAPPGNPALPPTYQGTST